MTEPILSPAEEADADRLLDGLRERPEQYAVPTPIEAAEAQFIAAVTPSVRAEVADQITAYADRRRARAYQYAHELPVEARITNDCVTNAYYTAAAIARDGNPRNVHCSNCGDTRGGPLGHEISECQWRPCNTANDPDLEHPVPRHAVPDDGSYPDGAPVAEQEGTQQ